MDLSKEDYYVTFNKKDVRDLKVYLEYEGPIAAPIRQDQQIGNLIILEKDTVIKKLPIYAAEEISKVNFFKSLLTSLNYLIWGDV